VIWLLSNRRKVELEGFTPMVHFPKVFRAGRDCPFEEHKLKIVQHPLDRLLHGPLSSIRDLFQAGVFMKEYLSRCRGDKHERPASDFSYHCLGPPLAFLKNNFRAALYCPYFLPYGKVEYFYTTTCRISEIKFKKILRIEPKNILLLL